MRHQALLVKIEGPVTGIPSITIYLLWNFVQIPLLINQWEKDIYARNSGLNGAGDGEPVMIFWCHQLHNSTTFQRTVAPSSPDQFLSSTPG